MDVNAVLYFDIWVVIAELSPSSFAAVRSINPLFREYSNKHMKRYKDKFSIKITKCDLLGKCEYYCLPNGNKRGLCTVINSADSLLTQYTYKNRKKHGASYSWKIDNILGKSDENLILRKTYKNGKRHGLYQEWNYKYKTLSVECYYVNGLKEGLFQQWNNDGKLQFQVSYKDGRKQGLYQGYSYRPRLINNDGFLIVQCNFENGKLHGLYQRWIISGILVEQCFYEHGKKHGLYQQWNKFGILVEQYIYEYGKKQE